MKLTILCDEDDVLVCEHENNQRTITYDVNQLNIEHSLGYYECKHNIYHFLTSTLTVLKNGFLVLSAASPDEEE